MAMDVNAAIRVGQFAQAAYAPLPAPIPFGYELVHVIYGNDLATDIGGPKLTVPFGYIARSPAPASDYVVAIRGTEGIWEWIQDARFLRIPCPVAAGAGSTDDGFTDVYTSLTIDAAAGTKLSAALAAIVTTTPAATLTITGHSLGAALASILALDVTENTGFTKPAVYTFASPLVGDAQFAKTYDTEVPNTWRIANAVDLVPKLPPPFWGYDHVNQLYSVNSLGKAKLLPACAHALNTYLFLLNQIVGGAGFPLDPNCV